MHYCKFLTTVLLSMTAGLLSTIPAAAQTCTTTWPYLYPDFRDGTVYMSGGRSQHLKFNIHMLRTTLHYVELGMIKEAYPRDIDSIRIGNDLFRYVNGAPMRVAAAGTSGYVAELLQGDFASALEGSGAYGMSAATISKTELSSLEVSGGTNQNHMLLLQNKDQGRTADIVTEYFIVTDSGKAWPANRKDILQALPELNQPVGRKRFGQDDASEFHPYGYNSDFIKQPINSQPAPVANHILYPYTDLHNAKIKEFIRIRNNDIRKLKSEPYHNIGMTTSELPQYPVQRMFRHIR